MKSPKNIAAVLVVVTIAVLALSSLFSRTGLVPPDFEAAFAAWARVSTGMSPYASADPFQSSPAVLALMRFLPADPRWAWRLFASLSLVSLSAVLLLAVRYVSSAQVARLSLGLVFAWTALVETLDRASSEIMILVLAVAGTAAFEALPALSGFLIGILPAFKLASVLLLLPFVLVSRTQPRGEFRFRRFLSGYLAGWVLWACALPSLTFGSERAQRLSRDWLLLLRAEWRAGFASDLNQSAWHALPPTITLGGTCILAGLVFGRLMMRTGKTTIFERVRGDQALGWISPWLLYMHWVSPLAVWWGSTFAVGIPLAWERAQHTHSRLFRWTCAYWIGFLWLLQQPKFLGLFGISNWSELHGFGLISYYWVLLLGLA